MADLIDRQAVQELVDRIGDIYPYRQIGNRESYSQYNEAWTDAINRVDAELNSLPSADIDLSGFSDKLWQAAYERGKAEVVRCKDCKHYSHRESVCKLLSNNYEPPVVMDDDDYCSRGERKDPLQGAMNPPEDDITDDKGVTK